MCHSRNQWHQGGVECLDIFATVPSLWAALLPELAVRDRRLRRNGSALEYENAQSRCERGVSWRFWPGISTPARMKRKTAASSGKVKKGGMRPALPSTSGSIGSPQVQ